MKTAIYCRVSTNDQTCDLQLRDLRQMAEHRGFEITRVYQDNGQSGAKTSRPALDEMLKDAKRGKFRVLLVWRLDRLGRSTSHLLTLLESFRVWSIDLISYSEGLDFTTPAGRMFFTLIAAFAEFERESVRERVRAGLRAAKAKGKVLGRPSNREISPQQIHTLLAAGKNHVQVAEELRVSRATIFRIKNGQPGIRV
jgi:DNA invertase Pin-like site-specific DNA recombinase